MKNPTLHIDEEIVWQVNLRRPINRRALVMPGEHVEVRDGDSTFTFFYEGKNHFSFVHATDRTLLGQPWTSVTESDWRPSLEKLHELSELPGHEQLLTFF